MTRVPVGGVALVFCSLLVLQASTDPNRSVPKAIADATIKGHTLGESIQDFLTTRPADLKQLAECRSGARVRKATPYERQWMAASCNLLTDSVDNGKRFQFSKTNALNTIQFEFSKGKLVAIKILKYQTDFADAFNDMKSRFGQPTTANTSDFENRYGATMKKPGAIWITPSVRAVLLDSSDFKSRNVCYIEIRTRADVVDVELEKQAAHKNVLQ